MYVVFSAACLPQRIVVVWRGCSELICKRFLCSFYDFVAVFYKKRTFLKFILLSLIVPFVAAILHTRNRSAELPGFLRNPHSRSYTWKVWPSPDISQTSVCKFRAQDLQAANFMQEIYEATTRLCTDWIIDLAGSVWINFWGVQGTNLEAGVVCVWSRRIALKRRNSWKSFQK